MQPHSELTAWLLVFVGGAMGLELVARVAVLAYDRVRAWLRKGAL
jgi:hypothetical protein